MKETLVAAVVFGLLTASCAFLRTPFVMEKLNTTNTGSDAPPRKPVRERVARLVAEHWNDAYHDPKVVVRWMGAAAKDPKLLLEAKGCLEDARAGVREGTECLNRHFKPSALARIWGLPEKPPPSLDPNTPEARLEMDAERWVANTQLLASSLAVLKHVMGRTALVEQDVRHGISDGAARAIAYTTHRKWHRRVDQPSTALVLSGGSANGAFSAGFVYRLLEVLEYCRRDPGSGCQDKRIDLVTGTSTGTLIGALVDVFHTPKREREAINLLRDNYTCSVEADLYCVVDDWDWELIDDQKGLVRFDGIAAKIDTFVTREVENNPLELVGVAVDLESGHIVGLSDQDPQDAAAGCGRRDALLASIVMPVLAEPVIGLQTPGGTHTGTFIDGGVNSVLPMLEAIRRGAERVVVLSNATLEPTPAKPPANAFKVLMRSLELFVDGARAGEVEQAEMAAVLRRLAENRVCQTRLQELELEAALGAPGAPSGSSANSNQRTAFCERRPFGPSGSPEPRIEGYRSSWHGPVLFPEVESSFRSTWVFRPESQVATAEGYSFDPAVMRKLFLLGVETFQDRCDETLRVLSITPAASWPAGKDPCTEAGAAQRIGRLFKPLTSCPRRELRECTEPISCERR
jgi:predicted acylesterase/phospholipase RssA